jgi:uncharacterized protein (TIGR03437 family)
MKILPILLLCFFATFLNAQTDFLITTVAGNGSPGFSGDNGPAQAAQLNDAFYIASDRNGDLYLTDSSNYRLRKISQGGVIQTLAGNGSPGFSGDGGPATLAQLNMPQGLVVDQAGNVYVADSKNNRIRKITQQGVITTIAGNGVFGLGGDNGPAISAQLSNLFDIAIDPIQNLYISDSATGSTVRRITPDGFITKVTGASFFDFLGPLAVDASGNVYAASAYGYKLYRITASGVVTTIAGNGTSGFSGDGGPAISAQLGIILGIVLDDAGNLYLSDYNKRIRRITPSGIINTVAGGGVNGDGGPATMAQLENPRGLAIDSSRNIYVADGTRIRKLIPAASVTGCQYSVEGGGTPFGTSGGTGSVVVIAARSDCPWLATSNVSWITITSGASGTGNGAVSFTVSPNPLSTTRTAILAIAGQIVTISQPGSACVFFVGNLHVLAPTTGLSGQVSVSTNLPDCTWSAVSNTPWLFVISGSSGQGNGTVSYAVAANSGSARTGTLTVAGGTVFFSQASPTSISSVGSSATGTAPFAPGQLVSLYGTQLGPPVSVGAQIGPDGVVTKLNGGTQVLFDGVAAPIVYAGVNQVNAAIPCSLDGKSSTQMVVEYLGIQSAPFTLPLSPAAPGIFTIDGSGKGPGAVLNEDYSVNSSANPAARGSAVSIYATGIGVTSPCIDGQIYQSNFPIATLSVAARVGNVDTQILYGGQAPYFISGLAQINIVVPNDAPTGVVPLSLFVGGISSQPGVTIAVK